MACRLCNGLAMVTYSDACFREKVKSQTWWPVIEKHDIPIVVGVCVSLAFIFIAMAFYSLIQTKDSAAVPTGRAGEILFIILRWTCQIWIVEWNSSSFIAFRGICGPCRHGERLAIEGTYDNKLVESTSKSNNEPVIFPCQLNRCFCNSMMAFSGHMKMMICWLLLSKAPTHQKPEHFHQNPAPASCPWNRPSAMITSLAKISHLLWRRIQSLEKRTRSVQSPGYGLGLSMGWNNRGF